MLIKLHPPRWDCVSEAAIERFEAWTNKQLDAMFERPDEHLIQLSLLDPKFVASGEKQASEQRKRGGVIVAARVGDHETLARLANTEELLRLAFKRHKRGREKGERRPRDLRQLTKWCCEEALADVEHIRQIWKNAYGKRNRTSEPTAIGIAARRYGIEVDTLINFKKNRHRRS
jgi:hypothetical protein